MDTVQVLGDQEQIIIIRPSGVKDWLITLRGACREGLIPRQLEHARLDRHRYRCPDPYTGDGYPEDHCESDSCFPKPEHREGDRDFYDLESLEAFYDNHPQLRSRPAPRRLFTRAS